MILKIFGYFFGACLGLIVRHEPDDGVKQFGREVLRGVGQTDEIQHQQRTADAEGRKETKIETKNQMVGTIFSTFVFVAK